MFCFPILEAIEKWLKRHSPFYWAHMVLVSILGFITVLIFEDSGFDSAKPLLVLFLVFWLPGTVFVAWSEKNWRKHKEGGDSVKKY